MAAESSREAEAPCFTVTLAFGKDLEGPSIVMDVFSI